MSLTSQPAPLPGFVPVYSGKVRDLYAPLDPATGSAREDQLLLVASDRLSAYDVILDTPIPDKGEVLTRMSLWWFEQLADLVPHHVLASGPPAVPAEVAGRAVLVKRLTMLPVECVARAYLTGGGLTEYVESGAVSGIALPPGLVDGSRLPQPLFTPSTKAPQGEHDAPIAFETVVELIGKPLAERVRDLTVAILARGNEIAAERGILLADTKVEFGVEGLDGQPLGEVTWRDVEPDSLRIVLADEVLTPDSSRFWPADEWQPGRPQSSFDKQFVRNWLTSPASGWDRRSGDAPPPLPQDVVQATRERYIEAFERLTGQSFD